MTITPHGNGTGGCTALDELRAAYHAQLTQLAGERDEARRQARRAKDDAAVARAELASLTDRVRDLLNAAARHLPDLPAIEAPAAPAALPAAPGRKSTPDQQAAQEEPDGQEPRAAAEPKHKTNDRRNARGTKRRPVRAG
ncbi:hypothetical protein AGRA3207_006390 [Actinomadura graeca]|uniref:Uncharacterized protein n=1 Tax=Actinomadura graeca TaxID=2750812 RepID=A0ABX8R3W3_9ACTN|nr:hypothetical protein [Actinomadura graeca]QXJ24969.1 hypothetical protein AGRA3207_006390 [Actinomadura graeca]